MSSKNFDFDTKARSQTRSDSQQKSGKVSSLEQMIQKKGGMKQGNARTPEPTDDMYFLNTNKHYMDPGMSKMKGYNYMFMLPLACKNNPVLQEMTVMNHANQFFVDT